MGRTVQTVAATAINLPQRLRAAAYARVSTEKDTMLHSLASQISYYSDYIRSRPGWIYCGVFSDEAKTGTKTSRDGFQALLRECRAGNIDLVIVKSISRFARNTVTLLKTVRELKAIGVDIFFEEENIHSSNGEGELLLTLLAGLAQAESLSVSENCKWSIRHGYEEGHVRNWPHMYGYKVVNGEMTVIEQEANVIREICDRVLVGESLGRIASDLNRRGIPPKYGKVWQSAHISLLLRNEKLTGNVLAQKTFSNNYINKEETPNRGELPKYYIEENHPPIISQDMFQQVNAILGHARFKSGGDHLKQYSCFTGKIECLCCGGKYKHVTTRTRTGFNCSVFQRLGKKACPDAKLIPDSVLRELSASVLGLDDFDEDIFCLNIAAIRVPGPNHLTFVFKDGHTVERCWKDKRPAEWTQEMRQRAREYANEEWRNRK